MGPRRNSSERKKEDYRDGEGGVIEYSDGVFRLNTDKALAGAASADAAEEQRDASPGRFCPRR